MKKNLTVGLMGCGLVADYGHIPAIQFVDGLHLGAVYDLNPLRAQTFGKKYGVPAFATEEQFFASGIDVVTVTSSAPAHLDNVAAAAAHNLPVLCEKPLAMNDADARAMVTLMASRGLPLYVGFVYRASPVAQQIKRWVDDGIIGEVRSLRLPYLWNLHGQFEQDISGEWVESPRWRGRMLEGGPLVDCGVHQIDLARWWLGSEVLDWTVAAAWVADYEAPDHLWLHMNHACGALSTVEMSFTYGHTAHDPLAIFEYQLIGTGGVIRYDRNGWILEARSGATTIRVPGESEKNFSEMYGQLERALRTGETGWLATGDDGIAATEIARSATNEAITRRRRDNSVQNRLGLSVTS